MLVELEESYDTDWSKEKGMQEVGRMAVDTFRKMGDWADTVVGRR